MRIISGVVPGVYRLARLQVALSRKAGQRLKWFDYYNSHAHISVRAIEVDGGSEFEAIFEEECQRRDIKLFVLPPRSPKLNGGVERAHRTHTESFLKKDMR